MPRVGLRFGKELNSYKMEDNTLRQLLHYSLITH